MFKHAIENQINASIHSLEISVAHVLGSLLGTNGNDIGGNENDYHYCS